MAPITQQARDEYAAHRADLHEPTPQQREAAQAELEHQLARAAIYRAAETAPRSERQMAVDMAVSFVVGVMIVAVFVFAMVAAG